MAGSATGGSLIDDAKLKQLYATMLRCRLLTEHARSLRNRPTHVLYYASLGQEAIATGCAIDLRPQDTIALAPHDSIAGLVKGVALSDIVAQLYARPAEPVARSTTSLALHPCPRATPGGQQGGLGQQAEEQHQRRGRFHHGGNRHIIRHGRLAGSAQIRRQAQPAHHLCRREQSLGRRQIEQRKGRPHPERAREGLTSITVDGNDVVAVYRVACESLERVRQGGGPVLVEAKTYRPDGQALLRTERDPLAHMERYLRAKKLFTARWKIS